MAWLSGWLYAKEIFLDGQSGAGTLYQVDLIIGASAGGDFHCEGHCANFPQDIAVTDNDGTTLLDFWIEDITADPLTMWVEVADDLGSNQSIRVYYGKSGASTNSDIGETFLFGDDFEGTTLDTSKWNDITVGGTFGDDIANSILTLDSTTFPNATTNGEGIESIATPISSPVIVNYRYKQNGNGLILRANAGTFTWSTPVNDDPVMYGRSDDNLYHEDIGGWQDDLYTRARDTSWHTTEMRFTGTNLKYYEDGSLVGTGNESTTGIINDKIILGTWRWVGGTAVNIDWVFARKYNSPEPAFSSASSEYSAPRGLLRNPPMTGGMV